MEQLYSYYPTHALLNEIVSYNNYKNINIFLDVKNNLQTLFMKDVVLNLITESMQTKDRVDTSIFKSIVSFISFHKEYFSNRNITSNFYLFYDSGKSYYHTNIDKQYKANRSINDYLGLDTIQSDYFEEMRKKNFMLTESVLNKIPKTYVIHFDNMETDFIPYYLMRNKLVNEDDDTVNVVYSNDHDLFQCLNLENNVLIYTKSKNGRNIVKKGDAFKTYYDSSDIDDSYFTLAMSIVGDRGDYVFGVNSIGKKRIVPILKNIQPYVKDISTVRENVKNNKPIFENLPAVINDKYIKLVVEEENKTGVISKNMKLVDFELISSFLDGYDTTMINRRKKINNIINNKQSVDIDSLAKALKMIGTYFDGELELCYKP